MQPECTNLLPIERQRSFKRDYIVRLGVVILALVILLIAVAAVLLLPTYVFLAGSARTKRAHLAAIESTLSSSNETALSAELAVLQNNATALVALGKTPSVSVILRAALDTPRQGISITGFTYLSAKGKSRGTLAISGVAATRDALHTYQIALGNLPFASSVDLPVSVYAKDTNLAFTITVTLTP